MPGLFTPAPVTGWWAEVSGITVTPGGRTLTVTGASPTVLGTLNKLITPTRPVLTVTGGIPTIIRPVAVTPGGAVLTVTGGTPVSVLGILVTPTGATLTVAGSAPTVATPQVFTPSGASLTLFGGSPGLVAAYFTPTDASLTLAGGTPTVVVSNNQSVTPSGASPAVTGGTPVVTTPRLVTPGGASLAVTGGAPTVSTPRLATPAGASLTVTGGTPVVGIDRTLTPTGTALAVTGGTPIVRLGTICAPTGAALALTGGTPTVTVSAASTVIPYTIPFLIPTTPPAHYTDSFNRANSASLGANWTADASVGADLIVSSNVACAPSGSGSAGGNVYVSPMNTGDNQITLVMKGTASAGAYAQVIARINNPNILLSTQSVTLGMTQGSPWTLIRYAADSGVSTGGNVSWADGDTILFTAVGATLTVKKNGSTVLTTGGSTDLNAGYVEIAYIAADAGVHGFDSFDALDI